MWGPLFDGEGIEFEHLQRMAQLQQQQRTNKLLHEMANNAAAERSAPRRPARKKVDPVLAKQRAADRETNRRREAAGARDAERKREEAEFEKYRTKSGNVPALAGLISVAVLVLACVLRSADVASYGCHALVASVVMVLAIADMRNAVSGMFIGPLCLLFLGCLLGWLGFSPGVMTVSYLLVLVPTLAFFLFEVSTLDTQQQGKLYADGVNVLTGLEKSGLQQKKRT